MGAMPSTLVHLAFGGLLAAALLGEEFDARSLLVVSGFVVLPDLDVFVEPFVPGAHRSLGHTLLLPAAVFAVLALDARRGAAAALYRRFGLRGVRVAWVGAFALLAAAIVPDLCVGGVNAFYPLHDQFYTLNGQLYYSTDRGWVQTLVDLSPEPTGSESGSGSAPRTTDNFRFRTVLDAEQTFGTRPADRRVERIFPVATSGFRLALLVASTAVVGLRLLGNRLDGGRFARLFEE